MVKVLYFYHIKLKKAYKRGKKTSFKGKFANYLGLNIFNNNKRKTMKNISKLLVVITSSLLVSLKAFAGELTVTGSAKASYAISGGGVGNNTGNALGISNELKFAASGELDNGFTWSYFMELDGNDGGAHDNDDSQLAIGMGDMGTIKLNDSEGGLSTETAMGIGALGVGDDYANTGAFVGNDIDVSSYPNIEYNLPAVLPFGIGAKLAYVPNTGDGDNNSYKSTGVVNAQGADGDEATMYQLTATPIEGLGIGADYIEFGNTSGTNVQTAESGGFYAKYAVGNFKLGYHERFHAPAIDGAARISAGAYSYILNGAGIEFALNDSLSISYMEEESEKKSYGAAVNAAAGASPFTRTVVTAESKYLQAAYDIGGATIGVANVDSNNSAYSSGTDKTLTIISLAIDF